MKKTPLVSIIIPVYNAEKYVKQAILSILDQSYKNLEILISDDGSSDKSKKIIKSIKDKRIKLFHNEKNMGYLKTCNKLFKKTTGSFIAFQDADDWSHTSRIELTLKKLMKNPTISMCGCNFIRNDENGNHISSSDYPLKDEEIKEYINYNKNLPYCGASVILRKNVLDEVGGYNNFFDNIGYEHFDWFLRISEIFEVSNIKNQLYYYRYSENSFSRSNKLNDYKKYHARDIAFFLRTQSKNNNFDGLTGDKKLADEFYNYLKNLKYKFGTNRYPIYSNVIKNYLSNNSIKIPIRLIFSSIGKKEISFLEFMYLLYRIFRTLLKKIIRNK